ncbi:hypothetical protein SAMN02745131_02602 [Flavisolibacter ginsengisoli DSM 18119]|jgi:hypothetical protein|uniref:Uncharacterized protein n=1 Tax=Flavisolibacter ginsengisoli DSM 18119 TaxID=1121884 RepID=A0A1M5BJ39_9BACT|nr:hypothetical protein SAMN02745131_02602 [Flavisolibacter ginsengisoli DSM 18119]
MNILFIVFFTFCLLSCNSSQSLHLDDVLKSDCFWDITGDKEVIGELNSCYKFLPNGQCFFYYYNFRNHKRTDSVYRYDDFDVIVPDAWSAKGDTLVIARGTYFKVVAFSKDSVLVETPVDTMVFRKNCHTIKEGKMF